MQWNLGEMKAKVKLDFQIQLTLNETELRALDGLVGYGFNEFINVFYEKMGRHYLQPHEGGLRSLFDKIEEIRPNISYIDKIKKEVDKIC